MATQSQFHSVDFWDAAASYAEYIYPFTAASARDALAEAALAPGARARRRLRHGRARPRTPTPALVRK